MNNDVCDVQVEMVCPNCEAKILFETEVWGQYCPDVPYNCDSCGEYIHLEAEQEAIEMAKHQHEVKADNERLEGKLS
jgi:DNA-directed RNA polymerase subunit RPC12/RpoP